MISALSTYRISFTGSKEANIIETGTNGAGGSWDMHTGLIDGEGLAGTLQDVNGNKCGVSSRGSTPRAFLPAAEQAGL